MPITISKRLKLTAQLTRGLFLTDPNRSPWGRVWQLFSRFTWELPQTLVGWLYSVGRALAGQIDRVDTLGGITFATKSSCAYLMGVSLGTFVDLANMSSAIPPIADASAGSISPSSGCPAC